MAPAARKKREPQLKFTTLRNIGWHVAYRGPKGPRKHKFELYEESDKPQAKILYYKWLSAHMAGQSTASVKRLPPATFAKTETVAPMPSMEATAEATITRNGLAHIALEFLKHEESRIRPDDGPRRKNTIERKQYFTRKKFALSFLKFINDKRGEDGACNRIKLADVTMQDVEEFNKLIADRGDSDSSVTKTMQCVKKIIDTGGRPELGQQTIQWNWDSRRKYYGLPQVDVVIPTLPQLKAVLKACEDDVTRTCQIWMALGLAFGQSDLSDACPVHFDKDSYDMRRGKTQRERFGDMPPLVWKCIRQYLLKHPRPPAERLFLTERDRPLVHGNNDAIEQWWTRQRKALGEVCETMNGFYSLRHVSATEFGSRPSCSLASVRTFLGHSASSAVCDNYMRPLAPEHKETVAWLRRALETGKYRL